jgi:hypothetical protein
MKRYFTTPSEGINIFEEFERKLKAPRTSVNVDASPAGVSVAIEFHPNLGPVPAPPAPAPAQIEASDDMDADDEGSHPRRRSNSYGTSMLSASDKGVILDLLDKMSVPDTIAHLAHWHPRIARLTKKRTLYDWQKQLRDPEPEETEEKARGVPAVLDSSHRAAMGRLLKELGNGGSPMNWKITRPILVGYLKDAKLDHLFSENPAKGKLSLSQTYINDLFLEFKLVSRSQTTDAQSLPQVIIYLYLLFISSIY